jgi:SAM-dependent methyltransferase
MAHEEGLAAQHAGDPSAVKAIYNDWSSTYDNDTTAWGYEAPDIASGLLAALVSTDAQVLDAGCGTGQVGAALAARGFHDVVGIDLSAESLDVAAASSNYRAVTEVDLGSLPTPLLDDSFSALICVGVMTYFPDVESICREFCRIIEPFGTIVLTQRTDLFESRNTQTAFDALEQDQTWKILEVTPERPYLPQHPEYEGIEVRYGVFERL